MPFRSYPTGVLIPHLRGNRAFVALCADARQKQHPEFKIPSSGNPSGGYKGADKATFLSMI
jgi:hypothetical protein